MKETIKNEDAAVFRNELVRILSGDRRILGVGQTGDIHAPLIPGKSDIDLFVICSSVPSEEERSALYGGIKEKCESVHMPRTTAIFQAGNAAPLLSKASGRNRNTARKG